MTLAAGTKLGPYEILTPLGAGAMGEVYRARDTRLGRDVAIKVPPADLLENPAAVARFEREARAVASLAHPNVLDIHDFGKEGDVWYAVTELLEGETLRERLSDGPLPWREAVDIGICVMEGLAAAHDRGIVHRDVKPENIFLTSDGRVKVLDFGLARMLEPERPVTGGPRVTATGTVVGTVGYMSPEQVRGEPLDPRSDLFSAGCVLFEMLAGEIPFSGPTAAEGMVAILRERCPDLSARAPDAPDGLCRIVDHCLEKNREARVQSARDVAHALKDLASAAPPSAARARPITVQRRRLIRVLSLLLVTAGLFVAARLALSHRGRIDSVAVLPFVNAGGDEKVQYLSDGLTESLIHRLSRLPGLRVPARTAVFAYRGEVDPRKAGHAFDVAAVVDGKISRHRGDLVLDVELVDVARGTRLWGERFQRREAELLDLQEDVAREIAERLRTRLTGAEAAALARRVTDDPVAYDLYLQGRYHWNKRQGEDLTRAIELFEQVIRRDPRFAAAHAALAQAYDLLAFYGAVRPSEVLPRAREQAGRAIELDPTLAEAHAALADVKYQFEWDWAGAEEGFRRAIALDPNSALARQWYSNLLSVTGRFEASLREIAAARRLDPMDLMIRTDEGLAYYWAGRTDRAKQLLESTIALEPALFLAHEYLGLVEAGRGNFAAAIEHAGIARNQLAGVPDPIALYGYACARAGRRADAEAAMSELEELSRHRFVDSVLVAVLWIGLEDKDRTFAALERSYVERSGRLVYLKVERAFDPIRSDPRFANLVARLRFPG
jgi:serine/threonine-protein kinase